MTRRRKKAHDRATQTAASTFFATPKSRSARVFSFLVASGLLTVLISVGYQYYAGNISVEFVQVIGRGYEFQLKNDTPSDRTVKTFRVDPPHPQKVFSTVTQDVYASVGKNGEISLPGGNESYVPATDFKELDGRKLPANSSTKFRVPPLFSKAWMQPNAMIVDIRFEIESSNPWLSVLESAADAIGIRSNARVIRYLVVDNHWAVSNSNSIDEAIRVFCRDDESVAQSSSCRGLR